jgi:hypothetical protein
MKYYFWCICRLQFRKLFHAAYYDFIYGIRNLVHWLPIIWRDRQWDDSFYYKILLGKIRQHKKYLDRGADQPYFLEKKHLKQLRLCEKILDELITERFASKLYDAYYPKHGHKLEDVPGRPGLKKIADNTDEERELIRFAIRQESIYYNKYRKLLFKIIEENISNWGD